MPEIELKLRASPARLNAAFARLSRQALPGSAFTQNLRATYFDTAKDDLHAKGLSFRVRDEDGRFVQTLKQDEAAMAALTRREWSDPVATAAPKLIDTQSGRKLRRVCKDVRLLPRFRTEIRRRGFVIRLRRGAEVEVMLDRGKIRAIGRDDAALQVCEIELELKKGSPAAIYDVALQILAATPVQIETRSKSDRGYALQAPGAGAIAVKANAPRADRGDSLATLLRGAARCHFGQFIANLQGALEHDADSIYQMRVAMRRLSAALLGVRDLLPRREYEAVRMKPRDLLRSLGPARDWQVLGERLSELEDEDGTGAPVVRVIGAVAAGRRRALSGASRAMDSAGTARTVLEAMRWFEDLADSRHGRRLAAKAPAAAKGVLDALFARVRRRGRHFPRQSVADRHRLRIACKNLRYNVELFAALFGGHKVEKFIARLKPVQDDLGQLNDVNRARELLLGALAGRTPQKAAAAAVIARLEARVAAADRRARKHVAALRDARPFW